MGADLVERYADVFEHKAAFCAVFISAERVRKIWPRLERKHVLVRSLADTGYVLPVRFDDTPVPGLPSTVGYERATLPPAELAQLIANKVQLRERRNHLPDCPNRLYAALELEHDDEQGQWRALKHAESIVWDLADLTDRGRAVVAQGLALKLSVWTSGGGPRRA